MTYLEMRQQLAALAARHSIERQAILDVYNAQDQSAARIARAAHARLLKGAHEWLDAWAANPATMALQGCTPAEIAEARLACTLNDLYQFIESPTPRVVALVT